MKKRMFAAIILFGMMIMAGCDDKKGAVTAPADTPTTVPQETIIPQETPVPTVTQVPTPTATPVPVKKRESIPFAENQLYAVAYLGYETMEDMEYYAENFLDEAAVPLHHFSGGEYYLIIPRYDNMSVKLYRNDLATMGKELVYENESCEPFIIRCNVSDIFPDVTIELTYAGETVEFLTYISLRDGNVEVGERGLDLTK